MQGVSASGVLLIVGLALAGAGFIGIVFLANHLLSPRRPDEGKTAPYECGMEQAGGPWRPFNLRFATIALLFVLFDAEAALLFAVAPALRGHPVAVLEVAAFAALLALGLAYAWRKGALRWPS